MALLVLNHVLKKGNLVISSPSLGVMLAPAFNCKILLYNNTDNSILGVSKETTQFSVGEFFFKLRLFVL